MNLAEAIKNVTNKKQAVNEQVVVGGGATGPAMVSPPIGGRAKGPGQSKVQGDLNPNSIEDGVDGVEETDPENNTKPTGDMSVQNRATVASKLGPMGEHVEAMFAGEDLSEEFKERAHALFEAAVNERVNEAVEDLENQFNEVLSEQIEQLEEQSKQEIQSLVEKLDEYLDFVVEGWLQENQIALEHSLRTEITEEFIEGMRNLFTENYINVPEDKFDVVEQLAARVEQLESKLNEAVNENISLNNSIAEMTCQEAIEEISEGLTVIQADKLRKLSEGIEFDSIDNFKRKVSIIKENYFPAQGATSKPSSQYLEESFEGEVEKPVAGGTMSKYVTAISKSIVK